MQRLAAVNRSRTSSRRSSLTSWAGDGPQLQPQLPNGVRRHGDTRPQPQHPQPLANGHAHDLDMGPEHAGHDADAADDIEEHSTAEQRRPGLHFDQSLTDRQEPQAGDSFAGAYSHPSRHTAASTLEQLAAPSPARDSPQGADGRARGFAHTNGYKHANGYDHSDEHDLVHPNSGLQVPLALRCRVFCSQRILPESDKCLADGSTQVVSC